jgi:hypothetical protein
LHRILKHRKAKKSYRKKQQKILQRPEKLPSANELTIARVARDWSEVGEALTIEKTRKSGENDKKRRVCRRAKIRKEKRRKSSSENCEKLEIEGKIGRAKACKERKM